ncbi:unnamed protein product [Didymodactylos carnosus]|uniref:Uncharacterized protein n=1 Tax=Didymodactylos carnosus TaxID=1234261 RepID=A0A8S2GMT5_9BILA|nr:unnamed protein product [Didymodactylos carnosus]CAF3540394.1 unnamed protein product [Didymodactylos carnosus]
MMSKKMIIANDMVEYEKYGEKNVNDGLDELTENQEVTTETYKSSIIKLSALLSPTLLDVFERKRRGQSNREIGAAYGKLANGNEDAVLLNIRSKVLAYGIGDQVVDIRLVKEKVKTEEEVRKADAPKMVMSDESWYIIRNTLGVTGFIGSSGKGTKPFPMTSEEILRVVQLELGTPVKIIDGEHQGSTGHLTLNEIDGEIGVELDSAAKKKEIVPVQFFEIEAIVPVEVEENKPMSSAKKSELTEQIVKREHSTNLKIGNSVFIKSGSMAESQGTVSAINLDRGIAIVTVDLFGRQTEVEAHFDDLELDNQ